MTNALIAKNTSTLPDYLKTEVAVGNENVSASELAIPYISLLQNMSKPCQKGSAEYIKGAEPGQFYNTATKAVTDELFVANMFFDVVFSVNKRPELGDEFLGEFASQQDAEDHISSEGLNISDYMIKEVHKHTLALFNESTGDLESAAIYSFRNTALKASRSWNTQIVSAYPNADRFAGIWKLSAKLNTNNKGSWYTPEIELAGYPTPEVYELLQEKFKLWRQA